MFTLDIKLVFLKFSLGYFFKIKTCKANKFIGRNFLLLVCESVYSVCVFVCVFLFEFIGFRKGFRET